MGARRFFREIPVSVRVVLAADVLSNIGNGLVIAFTAIYVGRIHDQGSFVGALAVGAIALGGIPGNVFSGGASDRIGAALVLAGGWLVSAAGAVALLVASNGPELLAACLLAGVGIGTAIPAQRAVLGQLTEGEMRRVVFGASHGLANVGFTVGAAIAGVVVASGGVAHFRLLYGFDALCLVLATSVLLIVRRRFHLQPSRSGASQDSQCKGTYRQVLADRRFRFLCLLSGLIIVFGFSQFIVAFPLVLSGPHGISTAVVAVAVVANTLTVAFGAIPIANLTRRLGRPVLVVAGSSLFSASWVFLLVFVHLGTGGGRFGVAIGSSVVSGLAETLLAPSLGPLVNDLAPDALRGRYNAVDTMVLSVGTLVGPVLTGLLLSGAGETGLLIVLISGCGAAALFAGSSRVLRSIDGVMTVQTPAPSTPVVPSLADEAFDTLAQPPSMEFAPGQDVSYHDSLSLGPRLETLTS
jgi:MFS family permease